MNIMNNMEEYSKIINWENVFLKSDDFKNKNPTKFTFLENIFYEDFYKKLYETFPKIDTFTKIETPDKSAFRRWWGKNVKNGILDPNEEDKDVSPEWNLFYRYLHSNEFIEKIQKFSKINVNKTKHFVFLNMLREIITNTCNILIESLLQLREVVLKEFEGKVVMKMKKGRKSKKAEPEPESTGLEPQVISN